MPCYKWLFQEVLKIEDKELIAQLVKLSSRSDVKRGTTLIKAGSPQRHIFFLESGIIRAYFVDSSGRDITDCIVTKPGSPAMPGARLDVPAPANVEAIADSTVIALDARGVAKLLDSSLEANRVFVRILQEAWQLNWEHKRAVCQLKADDRYLWFCRAHPRVISQVPSKYIASFLGMTPVTLSRIRTRLRKQGLLL